MTRSQELLQHWDNVRALGCILTMRPHPTLHHCHGGSMPALVRGMGQKPSDWLVIPLNADLHVGNNGIDSGMGVRAWEVRFAPQIVLLDRVRIATGVNVWERAGIERPAELPDEIVGVLPTTGPDAERLGYRLRDLRQRENTDRAQAILSETLSDPDALF